MSRLLPLALLSALWLSSLTPAAAQNFTRRDVPRGQVSGLEMAIEGNLEVAPGGRLRWFVTVYEIVGGRDLRPAPKTEVRALASFHRSEPVAETDEHRRQPAGSCRPRRRLSVTGRLHLLDPRWRRGHRLSLHLSLDNTTIRCRRAIVGAREQSRHGYGGVGVDFGMAGRGVAVREPALRAANRVVQVILGGARPSDGSGLR